VGIVAAAGAIATIVYRLPAAAPLHCRFAAVARLQSVNGLLRQRDRCIGLRLISEAAAKVALELHRHVKLA